MHFILLKNYQNDGVDANRIPFANLDNLPTLVWKTLGEGVSPGYVSNISIDALDDSIIYIGGSFDTMTNIDTAIFVEANGIGRWVMPENDVPEVGYWSRLGTGGRGNLQNGDNVWGITSTAHSVYVAGQIQFGNTIIPCQGVLEWNKAEQIWVNMDNGILPTLPSNLFVSDQGILLAGSFTGGIQRWINKEQGVSTFPMLENTSEFMCQRTEEGHLLWEHM